MNNSKICIHRFKINDFRSDFAALNQHINRIRSERLPDDPPIPLDETIQNLQSIPAFADLRLWAAWNEAQNEMIGVGNLVFLRTEENQHMAQFDVTVCPEYRQHGLGRRLMALIAETAAQENRRLLMTTSDDRIPAGAAFMERLGAQRGLEAHTHQLQMAELDHKLLSGWLGVSPQTLDEFELGFWDGAYPERHLEAIAELNDLTNQQPFGDLEIEDMHTTPEQLRQVEQNLQARGSQRWTFYILDRSNGCFAGYTETIWNPNRPAVLRQDMTGVFPQYRNRGLGRWLKAAMLDKINRERPQVKVVRTENADSNAAMLKINIQLGFKPYIAETHWQVELQRVESYLQTCE